MIVDTMAWRWHMKLRLRDVFRQPRERVKAPGETQKYSI